MLLCHTVAKGNIIYMSETPKSVKIDSPHAPVKGLFLKHKVKWVQFGIERRQRQIDAIEQKNASNRIEAEGLQVAISELESAKEEIEQKSVSEDSDDGVNITHTEQILITHYEESINKLKQRHDALLSILNNAANQKVLIVNERDKGIDRLLDFYEIKLAPLEDTLKSLEKRRLELDMQFSIAEVRYKRAMAELQTNKNKYESVQAQLAATGASAKALKAIQQVGYTLGTTARSLNAQRQNIVSKISLIQSNITALNVQADKYRDERDALMRMRARRPINDKSITRERFGKRPTDWHEDVYTDTIPDADIVSERLDPIENHITGLNQHLNRDDVDDAYKTYIINPDDFYELTNISASDEYSMIEFIALLKQYYVRQGVANTVTVEHVVNTIYAAALSS